MQDSTPARGSLRLLLVEDNEEDAALLVRYLERAGLEVEAFRVETRDAFERAIQNATWDVVISDHSIPRFSSLDALALLKALHRDYPFIIVSGTISEDTAVDAMRAGAHDYVLKNNLARLAPAIARELGDAHERRQAREERKARQAIERQLQQSQKMEAVGRLAGGIAHDFNNLLTAILGFTGLALDKIASGDSAVTFELEQVKQAAERATRFTRQLLAFSRQQVLSPRPIAPADSIETMMPMLRQLMGADVELSIADRAGGKAEVDPGQFEQVVMNLAVNARDAMPHGGTLRLGTTIVDVGTSDAERLQLRPGRYILLSVADSGVGMNEQTRARIFEPFFTTKPAGKGTGLGLSTVYGIVKQSHGAIDVTTDTSQGTAFHVYLPLIAQPEPAAAAPATRAAPRGEHAHGTVLVAEDEESVRVLIETVLSSAGFEVFTAATGTEAAALLQSIEKPIDLLVTDVVMPGMIGPDLARLVLHRFPETRVLYITGYAIHSALPAIFMQEEALLEKPFLAEQLLAKVHDRLGRSS